MKNFKFWILYSVMFMILMLGLLVLGDLYVINIGISGFVFMTGTLFTNRILQQVKSNIVLVAVFGVSWILLGVLVSILLGIF